MFLEQLGVFAVLAGILLVLNVAQMWLNQMSKVVLRQGLVNDLLNEWLEPVRAFRLSNSGAIGANPDQRLQADAQHLTDLSTDLGIGLLQSGLLLLSFIGVLWALSRGTFLPIGGHKFAPARLSRMVRADLCRRRIVFELARRPSADRSQRRALRARSGLPLRPRARERRVRRHNPLSRRGRREGAPRRDIRNCSRKSRGGSSAP